MEKHTIGKIVIFGFRAFNNLWKKVKIKSLIQEEKVEVGIKCGEIGEK